MHKAAILTLTGLVVATAAADDWPQWRGPNRDGVTAAPLRAPAKWPDQLQVKWKITVGEGHSSPIYAANRIFQFSRLNDQEVLQAIDPATGAVIWKQSYPAPYSVNMAAHAHGKGPKSTPVFADGRVYTFGIGGILSCFIASDGSVAWRKDFRQSPDFGVAMSPIVWNGLLIAHVGNGERGGALTAFDAATGAEKWKWSGDGPAYASPVIAVFDKVPQVITQSQKNFFAVDARSGEMLWRTTFKTSYDQNSVTPVIDSARGLVIYSGLDNGIVAVRPVHKGPVWVTEEAWRVSDAAFYMNSPVLTPSGTLIGFSHKNKGQIVAIDPSTGAVKWRSNGRQGENASIVAAAGLVFILTNEAELSILPDPIASFQPLKRYTAADSAVWAHPLMMENGLVVKDATTLLFSSWN